MGLRFGDQGLGFRDLGLRFEDQGLEFRVWGLGSFARASPNKGGPQGSRLQDSGWAHDCLRKLELTAFAREGPLPTLPP